MQSSFHQKIFAEQTNKVQFWLLSHRTHNWQLQFKRKRFSYMWMMDRGIMAWFPTPLQWGRAEPIEKDRFDRECLSCQWYLSPQVEVSFSFFMKSSPHLCFRHECEENGSFEPEIMRWDDSEHISVIVDQLVISVSFFLFTVLHIQAVSCVLKSGPHK